MGPVVIDAAGERIADRLPASVLELTGMTGGQGLRQHSSPKAASGQTFSRLVVTDGMGARKVLFRHTQTGDVRPAYRRWNFASSALKKVERICMGHPHRLAHIGNWHAFANLGIADFVGNYRRVRSLRLRDEPWISACKEFLHARRKIALLINRSGKRGEMRLGSFVVDGQEPLCVLAGSDPIA